MIEWWLLTLGYFLFVIGVTWHSGRQRRREYYANLEWERLPRAECCCGEAVIIDEQHNPLPHACPGPRENPFDIYKWAPPVPPTPSIEIYHPSIDPIRVVLDEHLPHCRCVATELEKR